MKADLHVCSCGNRLRDRDQALCRPCRRLAKLPVLAQHYAGQRLATVRYRGLAPDRCTVRLPSGAEEHWQRLPSGWGQVLVPAVPERPRAPARRLRVELVTARVAAQWSGVQEGISP
jgi:hypothetical protein